MRKNGGPGRVMVTSTGRASLHWGSSLRPWRGGVYRWTEAGTCHQGPLSRRQVGRTQSRPPPPPHETDSVHPASSWGAQRRKESDQGVSCPCSPRQDHCGLDWHFL